MSQLTATAYQTRKLIDWIIIGIITLIVLQIVWGLFIGIMKILFPLKPPPPNHKFGQLPALKFPDSENNGTKLTYSLETIEGIVPQASDSAIVYFMPKIQANLLALTKTQEFAKKLEFDETAMQETEKIYRFQDPEAPLRTLRYDIVSNNFVLRYNFENDAGLFLTKSIPSQDTVVKESKRFLEQHQLLVDDFKKGTTKISFLSAQENKLLPVRVIADANAIRIDYFRKPISTMPLYTPNPDEGQIAFTYSGSENQKQRMIEALYTYWPIDYENRATYSLKTSQAAWEELINGGGYIARYPTNGKTNVVVRTVTLGYYDSFDPQTYLQPIFAFEGDDNFLAYVPAIAPAWVETK